MQFRPRYLLGFVLGLCGVVASTNLVANDHDFYEGGLYGRGYGYQPDYRNDPLRKIRAQNEFFNSDVFRRHRERLQGQQTGQAIPELDAAEDALCEAYLERLQRDVKGLSLNDLIVRGVAGKDWHAVEDLKADSPLKAAEYIAAFTGAQVFGNHLRDTIDASLGDWMDGFFGSVLGGFSDTCSWLYQAVHNLVLRRSGKPFTTKEIVLWRQSIDRILQDLEKVAQNLARIDARSRDKIARRDVDEDAADPVWVGQRESYERQLGFWVTEIQKRKPYYNQKGTDAVLFYAEQIEQLLIDIKENIIHTTKSSKDLGSTSVQSALTMRKNTLDLYFFNMLTLIAPRTAQKEKDSSATRLKPSRDRFGGRRYGGDYDYDAGYYEGY